MEYTTIICIVVLIVATLTSIVMSLFTHGGYSNDHATD